MQAYHPKIYVFVPLTIPGAKKTSLYHVLNELRDVNFCMISLEEIKKEIQESRSHLQSRTKPSTVDYKGNKEFQKYLANKLSILSNTPSSKPHLLYLKKNFPPNAWDKTFSLIREATGGKNVKIIALIPCMRGRPLRYFKGEAQIPFTSHFVLDCITKLHLDEDSKDYQRQGTEKTQMAVDFARHYTNIKFDMESMRQKRFDDIFILPFASEESRYVVPKEMEEQLIGVLEAPKDAIRYEGLIERITRLQSDKEVKFDHTSLVKTRNSLIQFFEKEGVTLNCLKSRNMQDVKSFDDSDQLSDYSISCSIYSEQVDDLPSQSVQSSQNKVPSFIGIFPLQSQISSVKKHLIKALELLRKTYPEDTILQGNALSQLNFAENVHITCFDIAGDYSRLQAPIYQKFEPDERLEFDIAGFVIIPNKAVVALCNVDRSTIEIETKFCNMMLVNTKDVQKSEIEGILDALFGVNKPLYTKYDGNKYLMGQMGERVEVKIDQTSLSVYIVGSEENLQVQAETRESFANNA